MKMRYALSLLLLVGAPSVGHALVVPRAIAAPLQLAQSTEPSRTVLSVLNDEEIAIQIFDGDFFFADVMQRHYGSLYGATDHNIRVAYDSETGEITVTNSDTNDVLYDYTYSLDEVTGTGDAPLTRNPGPTPVTYTTDISEDQIRIQISEGDFFFTGLLERVNGETFMAEDGRIRVVYDRDRGQIYVADVVDRTELYSYTYSKTD